MKRKRSGHIKPRTHNETLAAIVSLEQSISIVKPEIAATVTTVRPKHWIDYMGARNPDTLKRYLYWRDVLSKSPPKLSFLEIHRCDNLCKTARNGDLHMCIATGNIHECSEHACQRAITTKDARVCPLTGASYSLEMKALDVDRFNGMSSNDPTGSAKTEGGGGTKLGMEGGSSDYTPTGNDADDAKPLRVKLHPVLQREVDLHKRDEERKRVYGTTKFTPFVGGGGGTPHVKEEHPATPAIVKKRRLGKYEAVPVTILRQKLLKPTVTTTTKKKKKCQCVRRGPRMIDSNKIYGQAYTTALFLLRGKNCCDDPHHLQAVADHCMDTWKFINQSIKWQLKQQHSNYTLEKHCYVTIFQMRTGLTTTHKSTNTEYAVVPRSECVKARIMTKTELSFAKTSMGTTTKTAKVFKEYMCGLDQSCMAELAKATPRRCGGVPVYIPS
jgi:hypothetical protein